MVKQNAVKIFEEKKVRTVWDREEWYFSIVDVIAVLTDSPNPRKYWSVLKTRLKLEAETGKPVVTPLNAKDVLQLKENEDSIGIEE